ncbi:hypothetical protein J2S22_005519 [Rhodoplanes tepidamans]|uniref:Uncharacterized protein n=1 Tax=Rhodoplanes tepidamans TaxID=200616 RepID=A0ABT5JGP1_RHOTP|nr:hypothetical protein [Rhodoplanes tepidamans]MDC7788583.1 hypothetical protein [Rhodoplanes tepidamans]MDQ0358565.1 hypothetical protein [Rhodoplanes tepidamans]
MIGVRIAMACSIAAVPFVLPALAFDPPGRAERGREAERPGRAEPGRPDTGRPDAGRPDPGRADAGRPEPGPAVGRRPDGPPGPPPPGPPGRPDAVFRRDVIAPTTNVIAPDVVAPTVVAPGAGPTGVVVAPGLRGGGGAAPPPAPAGAGVAAAGYPAPPLPPGAVRTLPDGSVSAVMNGTQYFRYGPTLYRSVASGGEVVYVPAQ